MFLLLGIIVVGPVEDYLRCWLSNDPPGPGDRASQLIDQLTSWVLLLCLLAAALL